MKVSMANRHEPWLNKGLAWLSGNSARFFGRIEAYRPSAETGLFAGVSGMRLAN
jgi:hypothetical protein